MNAAPVYRVQVFAFSGASFAIGNLVAEFEQGMNVGWATYANDIPESFFTVNQQDPKLPLVASYMGKAHVRILRDADVVWAGWFGMEVDANETDVIFYNYGYLAGLYWSESDWNTQYAGATVGTIVTDAWTRAKTTLTNSMLAFITTGTIESPVTTSGGAIAITLAKYSLYNKRLWFVMREMAAVGLSDTTNRVLFEITHSSAPTFNFWKNRGTDRPDVVWRWGDDRMLGFRDYAMPVYRRNNIIAVGSAPSNTLLRTTVEDATDAATYGRRGEPIYFDWVRDLTELTRVTNLRATRAKRDRIDLSLRFYPNAVLPPGATGAGYSIIDSPRVTISRGITQIDANYIVVGAQVLYLGGNEHLQVLLQEKLGV